MDNNKIILVDSVLEDVSELAPTLRLDDTNELQALGLTPERALLRGFVFSKECYSVKWQGKTIGMFGVGDYSMPKGFGSVWFLGADECTNHPITFVKEGRRYISKWLKEFDIVLNAVDARNKSHIEWIKRIGLRVSNPIIINNYMFLQFYKVKGV